MFWIAWSVENLENKNPKIARANNERIMLLSKCAACDGKKSKFLKEQVVSIFIKFIK